MEPTVTPDTAISEIASILAKGYLHYLTRRHLPAFNPCIVTPENNSQLSEFITDCSLDSLSE